MRWIASVTAPVVASISPSRAMTRAAAWLIRALSKSAMAVVKCVAASSCLAAQPGHRAGLLVEARLLRGGIDQRDRLLVVVLRLGGGGEAGGVLGRVHQHAGRPVANGRGVVVIRGQPVCLEEM